MNRITYQKPDGTWGINGINIKDVPRTLYGAMCKLKDYENTGLDPQEIEGLRETIKKSIADVPTTYDEDKVVAEHITRLLKSVEIQLLLIRYIVGTADRL